eukprot:CAMPEP_0171311760 /NCGR_PEP_ID=MMETSP0816-20121228/22044_1 /TAXON_ID=420281 /ORGANISM="Proboscia inermis, Strain CCAP1064/1" /LENGTH=170 /DNA_ID=CAMNT_0011796757 /DNA_START=98 /DNA_END=610 /DNA_ORIENTATION=+
MNYATVFALALALASASAFAPMNAPAGQTTALQAAGGKKTIFQTISEMDLFAPKSTQNDYGARGKKKLTTGKIKAGSSYIPDGLTVKQYEALRNKEDKKKDANYARNVAKAGKFLDYTDFYIKRGTDTTDTWINSVTRGHDMAKTKYDWSGKTDDSPETDQSKATKRGRK